MDSRLYWIWLQRALPLGSLKMQVLLQHFGRPESVYAADTAQLAELGFSERELRKLGDKSMDEAEGILSRTLRDGDCVLTPDDTYYPDYLREMDGMPAVLYCRGEIPNFNCIPAIGVVGTREASASGLHSAMAISAGLAAGGMIVVSGGALGSDAAAHEGALRGGGLTVLVKAGSLEDRYPVANEPLRQEILKHGGLIVSEYPSGIPARCDFHVRNRLISGLSLGVCLVEVPERSGALITARLAREQGRDVYAVPGDVPAHCNDGAHRLIREGAALVTHACDILQEYWHVYPGIIDLDAAEAAQKREELRYQNCNPSRQEPATAKRKPAKRAKPASAETPPAPQPPVPVCPTAVCPDSASAEATRVFAALNGSPTPIDQIAETVSMPVQEVLIALTELEVYGVVRSHAGQRYAAL